jgi:hypothetical protein
MLIGRVEVMSTPPENELDLEKLFLPAWAQEPASANLYARYEGGEERPERGRDDRRGPRRERRGPPGERRGGERPRRPDGQRGERRPAGPSQGRDDRGNRPGRDRFGRGRGPRDQRDQRERREPPPPLPEVGITLLPDDKGVESLARQIRMTGRAYPLFEIAQMILQRPDRLSVIFNVKKNPEGKPIQPLFVCALDDTLWLTEDEAVAHVLKKHFGTFYQAERTATEPPKGKYTFVAQCGMSGAILGPPNHHDYQNQLRKLHSERFSRMPFEMYKSRVKIVRDEEVVKKWVEDQSWKTEYICLNLPEAVRLGTMEAVEKHFRETHKENIIKQVETHTMVGSAARSLRSSELARLVRTVWEDQRRFPLQIATSLSQQFATHGLQFFKVNKTITHVSVARPHYLDMEATPVSEGVKKIVDFINTHPKSNRRGLIETLAPSPTPPPLAVAPPTEQVPVEGQAPAEHEAGGQGQPAAPTPPVPGPTPEQTAVIADLHWLIHQGHVIEFANGILETAKKPAPKPPKPEPKPAAETPAASGAQPEAATPGEAPATEPSAEGVTTPSAEVAPPASDAAVTPSEPAAAPEPVEHPPAAASEETVEAPPASVESPS